MGGQEVRAHRTPPLCSGVTRAILGEGFRSLTVELSPLAQGGVNARPVVVGVSFPFGSQAAGGDCG